MDHAARAVSTCRDSRQQGPLCHCPRRHDRHDYQQPLERLACMQYSLRQAADWMARGASRRAPQPCPRASVSLARKVRVQRMSCSHPSPPNWEQGETCAPIMVATTKQEFMESKAPQCAHVHLCALLAQWLGLASMIGPFRHAPGRWIGQ